MSGRASEQQDGALPGDKERCKGETGSQQALTWSAGTRHPAACLAPWFCRISHCVPGLMRRRCLYYGCGCDGSSIQRVSLPLVCRQRSWGYHTIRLEDLSNRQDCDKIGL